MASENRSKKLEGKAKQRKHRIHNKGMANSYKDMVQKKNTILNKIDNIAKSNIPGAGRLKTEQTERDRQAKILEPHRVFPSQLKQTVNPHPAPPMGFGSQTEDEEHLVPYRMPRDRTNIFSHRGGLYDASKIKPEDLESINKECGVAADTFTPTFGGAAEDKKQIQKRIKAILGKSMSEVQAEAKQVVPKTRTQQKVLGSIEQFLEKYLDEEAVIQKFLGGYRKLALLSKSFVGTEFDDLLDIAKSINLFKGYQIAMSADEDRIDKVIFIDSVAHNLHKMKFGDGKSLYKQLDELADISKSFGESNRSDRLLLLQAPSDNKNKLESLGIHVLQKGLSLWNLYEKAIKFGVENLSNKELIILREFIWSKI